jgi:hypothetical protein
MFLNELKVLAPTDQKETSADQQDGENLQAVPQTIRTVLGLQGQSVAL